MTCPTCPTCQQWMTAVMCRPDCKHWHCFHARCNDCRLEFTVTTGTTVHARQAG